MTTDLSASNNDRFYPHGSLYYLYCCCAIADVHSRLKFYELCNTTSGKRFLIFNVSWVSCGVSWGRHLWSFNHDVSVPLTHKYSWHNLSTLWMWVWDSGAGSSHQTHVLVLQQLLFAFFCQRAKHLFLRGLLLVSLVEPENKHRRACCLLLMSAACHLVYLQPRFYSSMNQSCFHRDVSLCIVERLWEKDSGTRTELSWAVIGSSCWHRLATHTDIFNFSPSLTFPQWTVWGAVVTSQFLHMSCLFTTDIVPVNSPDIHQLFLLATGHWLILYFPSRCLGETDFQPSGVEASKIYIAPRSSQQCRTHVYKREKGGEHMQNYGKDRVHQISFL